MGRALAALSAGDEPVESAIDTLFRMAHSIKGMAASLGYDSITEVAHRLEDRMQEVRSAGRVGGEDLARLFKGLEELEALVAAVRDTGEVPDRAGVPPKKKASSPR